MDSSSSSPPTPSPYFFHGCNPKGWGVFILVPLLLVSLVVFSVDSRSSKYSFFTSYSNPSSSSSTSADGGGDDHSSEGGERGVAVKVPYSSSGHPYVSPTPKASSAPAPAPETVASTDKSYASEGISSLQRRRRRDVNLERLEFGLAKARAAIREAIENPNSERSLMDKDYIPQSPIYRNAYAFHRSYLEMEKLFKVYVYEEGEPPIYHDGPCKSIYASEGRFIHTMEMENNIRTRDPKLAHVYFLPFSVVRMVKLIYQPDSHDIAPLQRTIFDYISIIAEKYPYWNRSLGADHFMLSCHDWGPMVSKALPQLYSNSIRVLCNANASEGFNPAKDVSLPEINIQRDNITEMIGGPSASRRTILAFFAGGNHGPVRSLLLNQWKGKDEDIQVHEYLPQGLSYYDMMRKSKFCLCPSGYEVASPRIVEAIYLECVPVTINDHYVLPFSDVLNWKSFSVKVSLADLPNLKKILTSISQRQYIRMQRRVKMVRRHFIVNTPPKRFDVFHMILHSIWLRRLNLRVHPQD